MQINTLIIKTEYIEENVFQEGGFMNRPKSQNIFKDAESVEFAGQAVVKLSEDSKRISKTGKILWVCILDIHYFFCDYFSIGFVVLEII